MFGELEKHKTRVDDQRKLRSELQNLDFVIYKPLVDDLMRQNLTQTSTRDDHGVVKYHSEVPRYLDHCNSYVQNSA